MVPSFVPVAILRPFLAVEHHYLRPHQKPRGACAIVRWVWGDGKNMHGHVHQAPIEYWYN